MDLAEILKVDYSWLKEADSQVLQQALKDLDAAYTNFFAGRAGFKVSDKRVYLSKVGWVKGVFHRPD